jgi:hypothetical protein
LNMAGAKEEDQKPKKQVQKPVKKSEPARSESKKNPPTMNQTSLEVVLGSGGMGRKRGRDQK